MASLFRYLGQIPIMQTPQGLLDFLVYLAPSLLVFLTTWFLVKRFLHRESALKMLELNAGRQKELMPLRLQAYERLTLYLERISPNNMLLNQYEQGLTVELFQIRLIEMIRSEFEHNLVQQIYISVPLWTIIRNSKEELIRQINAAAADIPPNAPAHELSKRLFDNLLKLEEFPTQRAITILKNEVAQLF